MAGASAAIARLQEMLTAGVDCADEAAMAMGEETERAVRGQLSKASHALGTPTPAPVGGPPAMISGTLRDGVTTVPLGNGAVQVGGTAVYARIQQLGGYSGWNRATYTPARPYLEAAWEEARIPAANAAVDVIIAVVFSG